MPTRLKTHELREMQKDKLLQKLKECKEALFQLQAAQNSESGNRTRLGEIYPLRKNIARVLTVLSQKEREVLKKLYKSKSVPLPKSMRPKLTHRRRLALKPSERNRKTRRQIRMKAKYPRQVYAIKM